MVKTFSSLLIFSILKHFIVIFEDLLGVLGILKVYDILVFLVLFAAYGFLLSFFSRFRSYISIGNCLDISALGDI